MLCLERDSLRHEHQATVQKYRASIRDLVVLADNSAADAHSDFNLAHLRIRAARGVCDAVASDAEASGNRSCCNQPGRPSGVLRGALHGASPSVGWCRDAPSRLRLNARCERSRGLLWRSAATRRAVARRDGVAHR